MEQGDVAQLRVELPEPVIEHLFMVAKALSQAALKALRCKGTTIFVANGVAAGQRAPHFMIHIIPRNDEDGVPLDIPSRNYPKKELDAVAKALQKALGQKTADAQVVKEEKKAKPEPKKKKPAAKTKKKIPEKVKKSDKFDLDSVADLL